MKTDKVVEKMFRTLLNEKSSWEFLKETSLPIAVYGTGNGADRVFEEFEKLSISVSSVCASDGFVRKRTFRGFEVKSISQLESEFEDFVIHIMYHPIHEDLFLGAYCRLCYPLYYVCFLSIQ